MRRPLGALRADAARVLVRHAARAWLRSGRLSKWRLRGGEEHGKEVGMGEGCGIRGGGGVWAGGADFTGCPAGGATVVTCVSLRSGQVPGSRMLRTSSSHISYFLNVSFQNAMDCLFYLQSAEDIVSKLFFEMFNAGEYPLRFDLIRNN